MTSLQESNLIVVLRWFLLVDILLLSLYTPLSSTAEIKIRIDSEETSGFAKFPSQLNRQQRRYDDDNGYRHIHVDLEDTKEPSSEDSRKFANLDEQEPEETVLKISSTNEYVIRETETRHIGSLSHRGQQENNDGERHKNRVPSHPKLHIREKGSSSLSQRPLIVSNHNRGLVPQLWANYTPPTEAPAENVSCNTARFECSKRAGCTMALTSYAMHCTLLVADPSGRNRKRRPRGRRIMSHDSSEGFQNENVCSSHCRHSLIALMSTHEGQRMMKCNCEGDSFCERSKSSVAPCQEEVVRASQPDTIVSCTSAQWICAADPECSEALDWYKRLCRPMFKGRKCTKKCQNTIETLRSLSKRQNAAKKLETCYCDGTEDFKCDKIRSNMEGLCFRKSEDDILSNEIEVDRLKAKKSSSSSLKDKLERMLIIIVVFVELFVAYVIASVHVMVSSFDSQPHQGEHIVYKTVDTTH